MKGSGFMVITGIILMIVLIGNASALTFSPALPTNVSLRCGEVYNNGFTLSGENITIIPGVISSAAIGYSMGLTYHPTTKVLHASFFPTGTCNPGSATFSFNAEGGTYNIEVNTVEDLWNVFGDDGEELLSEMERLNIGTNIGMTILEIGDVVIYKLIGCGSGNNREIIEVGTSKSYDCEEDKLVIELVKTYQTIDVAIFKVYASENWLTSITESNETDYDESECVLGLDTLGAKVKRGNIFAIKTINANTGKFVASVAVTILDQSGELSPIAGVSSNIGFFSERLYEDYTQDLIVQLEKEGCEPSTQVILFESSYDDYKAGKEEEQGSYQIVFNMSGRYEMVAISNTVKNSLGEAIEGATVRITAPDNSFIDILTDANGVFSFTPTQVGIHKIQTSKDDYTPSGTSQIEIYKNDNYFIDIKVNGENKPGPYTKGDRITFELLDENNTILPLNIDATFAGQPLRFINGISDTITFEDSSTLNIPAKGSYLPQNLSLELKTTNWATVWWIIGIVVAVIVLIVIIIFIVKKLKGGGGVGRVAKAMEGADIKLP